MAGRPVLSWKYQLQCSHTHALSNSFHTATSYNKITNQNTTRKHIKQLLPMAP